ncbi:MAG: hypothetical protein ACXAB0_06650 [Candidatus Thorarchaeota archaeon]
MNSPHLVRKLQNAWKQLSKSRRILAGCIIISCIVSGCFTLHLVNLWFGNEGGEPPRIHLRLSITEEEVDSNGTVSFTVVCIVESYKNYPIPEGDLYLIRNAFICIENDLLDFNSTLGEIKTTSEIDVIEGDLSLSANEEVRLTFQTSFDLQNLSHVYVGVLANGPTGFRRWDLYTSLIPYYLFNKGTVFSIIQESRGGLTKLPDSCLTNNTLFNSLQKPHNVLLRQLI